MTSNPLNKPRSKVQWINNDGIVVSTVSGEEPVLSGGFTRIAEVLPQLGDTIIIRNSVSVPKEYHGKTEKVVFIDDEGCPGFLGANESDALFMLPGEYAVVRCDEPKTVPIGGFTSGDEVVATGSGYRHLELFENTVVLQMLDGDWMLVRSWSGAKQCGAVVSIKDFRLRQDSHSDADCNPCAFMDIETFSDSSFLLFSSSCDDLPEDVKVTTISEDDVADASRQLSEMAGIFEEWRHEEEAKSEDKIEDALVSLIGCINEASPNMDEVVAAAQKLGSAACAGGGVFDSVIITEDSPPIQSSQDDNSTKNKQNIDTLLFCVGMNCGSVQDISNIVNNGSDKIEHKLFNIRDKLSRTRTTSGLMLSASELSDIFLALEHAEAAVKTLRTSTDEQVGRIKNTNEDVYKIIDDIQTGDA